MNVIQEINNVNDKFATKGSKLKIEKRGDKLNIRGSLPCKEDKNNYKICLLYTSPSPRDKRQSRMPSSA